MSLRKIYYALPPAARLLVRKWVYLPLDLLQSRSEDEILPPKGLIYTGGGDFLETGRKFVRLFQEYAGLHADSHVLDIGSGIGRMAIPLTKVLDKKAKYDGFDVVSQGVDWCKEHIESRFPHFKFKYIPLYNDLYRSDGESPASYTFPYATSAYDLAISISVFTHMQPAALSQYLKETSRVLNDNGKLFATFFTYTKHTKPSKEAFSFPHEYVGYRLMDQKVKDANIAYDRKWLQQCADEAGLYIERINGGTWQQDQTESLDFQDVVVFSKKNLS